MKRHNARILAVMVLYNIDMNKYQYEEINDEILTSTKQDVFDLILDEDYKVEVDYEYLDKLLELSITKYLEIHNIISDNLSNWTIDRLSYVDRAILVCGTTEMMLGLVPKEVVINEYLEITREYAMIVDEKQVKFNNRVLDVIAKKIYE